MKKSIEERLIESHNADIQRRELRRIFDAYTDPRHNFWGLLETLGSIQKEFGADWMGHVIDCMHGMELHDMGLFPDEWLEEIDRADSLDDAFARTPKCGVKEDGTCDQCNGSCMWHGSKNPA